MIKIYFRYIPQKSTPQTLYASLATRFWNLDHRGLGRAVLAGPFGFTPGHVADALGRHFCNLRHGGGVAAHGGRRRSLRAWMVYCGNVLILLSNWIPVILAKWNIWPWPGEGRLSWQQAMALVSWPFAALTICTLVLFVNEMRLFQKPGRAIANMAASAFALIYCGLAHEFSGPIAIGLGRRRAGLADNRGEDGRYGRLPGRPIDGTAQDDAHYQSRQDLGRGRGGDILRLPWGLVKLAISIALHKRCRHAPGLGWSWIAYGILVGIAGILGDLAESLLKRDAGCKDSSTWMPGFGGVLDVLDSLLFAAPVGWVFWIFQSAG